MHDYLVAVASGLTVIGIAALFGYLIHLIKKYLSRLIRKYLNKKRRRQADREKDGTEPPKSESNSK